MACPHYIWWKCPSVYNILLTSVAHLLKVDGVLDHTFYLTKCRWWYFLAFRSWMITSDVLTSNALWFASTQLRYQGYTWFLRLSKCMDTPNLSWQSSFSLWGILEPSQLASDSHFKLLRYNFQNWPHVHNVIWVQFHTIPNDNRKHCKPKYPGWKLLKILPICFGI